jgi:hypothetical protein
VTGDGDGYPQTGAYNPARNEGGTFTTSINRTDSISGTSLQMNLTQGMLYAQFNPYNYAGNSNYPGPRAFARDYAEEKANWQFNTYNRMSFWIKLPPSDTAFARDGNPGNMFQVGTFVKQVANTDRYSDETGGGHYYHLINPPSTGTWVQVILNMHPDHRRSDAGTVDPGVLDHPTGEPQYNYFDTLTRFYLQRMPAPSSYPAVYLIDNIEFYQETRPENEVQVYSLAATYRASDNRLVVTWNRNKGDDTTKHEVRYAFSDIHASGWDKATPAPSGLITPPGNGPYNGMVYDTTALNTKNQSTVYVAIKPANSSRFTQIAVPLQKTAASPLPPAPPPPAPAPLPIPQVNRPSCGVR